MYGVEVSTHPTIKEDGADMEGVSKLADHREQDQEGGSR